MVQFMWGAQEFRRTGVVQCGRYLFKARGTVDGKGGLTLGYSEDSGGCWELGSPSGGTLYRIKTDAASPAGFLGQQKWQRKAGGPDIYVTIMQRSVEQDLEGWIDPQLLAMEKDY
eukprot:TRINITY_DN15833_c0_g1_i1.p1 TRINITY_DN15833_c0_g1~~TRINITY_DN15833_c0_g1_i1.p1  ORF type:complete len:115 (-),score=19.01 TRINITY_DN15833_c0_g1_i1:63-407(-)